MGLGLQEIIDALNGLTPAQQAEALADADRAIGAVRWVPNPGPQTDAYYSEADELFYGGSAGSGKALCSSALVLTPMGWRVIGSLKVGDKLCATDGTVQEVIGVYPQGVKALYRVTMLDGCSVLADLDHNWLAWRTADGIASKLTTAQILDQGLHHDFTIPMVDVAMTRQGLRATEFPRPEGRIIESIEYERDGEATCIRVSNANSLFITDDFIVTHNSDLAIGLALTEHTRSLILRRTNKESYGIVERMAEIIGDRDGWSGQQGVWRIGDKLIEVGGCQLLEDRQKYKGVPRDLNLFDEISDFLEAQYTFIIGWNRSAKPGQRCRVVCTGNPPTTPEGVWVVQRWAAWLDPTHPNPAEPGELRFYTTGEDGKEIEVEGRGPHLIGGELIEARSRTFIPAKLADNPDLTRDGTYASTLAALPIELRAAYRDGRFDLSLRDQAYQTIPTAWVKEAQERWRKHPPADIPMCCIGVDVAQGGTDSTVLAIRHGGWYAPLKETPGIQTPDGQSVAGLVVQSRRDGATVTIDMGGGYGASALEHLKDNGITVYAYKGSEGTEKRDKSHTLGFSNTRSAAYWAFREALDPSNQGGSEIALPPDSLLVSDLTCPTFRTSGGKISIMTKEDVTKKLGRSPDRGDAVIMAWWKGLKQAYVQGGFGEYNRQRTPQVVMGRQPTRTR